MDGSGLVHQDRAAAQLGAIAAAAMVVDHTAIGHFPDLLPEAIG